MTTLQSSAREELKARFEIDGFVNFGRVLDDSELLELSDRIDAICTGEIEIAPECLRFQDDWEAKGIARRDAVWQVLEAQKHDDLIRRICEKPLIRETIELFLEGESSLWSTQVIMKPAYHGGVVPWHQDSSYWGQEKRMTCWLAIDNATPFNGCMRMVPGTHKLGQLQFKQKQYEGISAELRETEVQDETQVYVPVPAGCASFHHPMTLHASDANVTEHRRRAIAITYLKVN